MSMKAPLIIPTWTESAPSDVAKSGTTGIRMYEPKKQTKQTVQLINSNAARDGRPASLPLLATTPLSLPDTSGFYSDWTARPPVPAGVTFHCHNFPLPGRWAV